MGSRSNSEKTFYYELLAVIVPAAVFVAAVLASGCINVTHNANRSSPRIDFLTRGFPWAKGVWIAEGDVRTRLELGSAPLRFSFEKVFAPASGVAAPSAAPSWMKGLTGECRLRIRSKSFSLHADPSVSGQYRVDYKLDALELIPDHANATDCTTQLARLASRTKGASGSLPFSRDGAALRIGSAIDGVRLSSYAPNRGFGSGDWQCQDVNGAYADADDIAQGRAVEYRHEDCHAITVATCQYAASGGATPPDCSQAEQLQATRAPGDESDGQGGTVKRLRELTPDGLVVVTYTTDPKTEVPSEETQRYALDSRGDLALTDSLEAMTGASDQHPVLKSRTVKARQTQ